MLISRSFISAGNTIYNKFLVKNTQKMAQRHITNFFKPKPENDSEVAGNTNKRLSTDAAETGATQKKQHTLKTPSPKAVKQTSPKLKKVVETTKTNGAAADDEKQSKSPVKEDFKLEEAASGAVAETANANGTTPVKVEEKPQQQNMRSVGLSDKDSTGVDYNPAKLKYHPIKDAFWQAKENTPYLALAKTFEKIEEIRSRLRMIEVLSNFFSSVMLLNPDDLLPCIYLSINSLAPAYEGLELGVAETILMKVICKVTGRDMQHIKSQTLKTGDLGIVAEQSRVAQRTLFRPAALTIKSVFQKLKKVANQTGKPKADLIEELFVACRYSEARYLVRSLIGKLRIGMAEQSLLQALAIAVVRTDAGRGLAVKSSELESNKIKTKIEETAFTLKTVYSQCPNYDKIIPTLLEHGMDELVERCPMTPGIPIKPMLAQPMKGVSETLERLQNQLITCEYKYDGERAQIHCNENGAISIYSRNQENNTGKYPDVISRIEEFKKPGVRSFMIDSEVVAWDIEKKQILPFQVLTTRKRKNVEIDDIKVQVCVFAFDLLYFNGESLVTQKFVDRRSMLKQHFQEVEGIWQFPTFCDTESMDEVQRFLEESIKGNCEGLMIKTLDANATYEISKRSHNWLKLKKDYLSNLGDSLDLVVIGGYWGKGKRTGIFGGFLLACYDAENEEFQSICKIGTGFSDEDLKQHADLLKQHIIKTPKSYYAVDQSLQPDEWFEPVQIWEIKCADLSLSPVHKAGIGIVDAERGISLRFPRFIRIREDKSAEDATSAQEVARMYSNQDQIKNQQNSKTDVDMEDGFY